MAARKKNVEFVDSGQEKKELKIDSVRNIIDGSLLTRKAVLKQLPFFLFLVFLSLIYIGNRYHAETVTRATLQLQDELNELRAESISTASELMYLSRQSQLLKKIQEKELGLKESRVPPKKIVK